MRSYFAPLVVCLIAALPFGAQAAQFSFDFTGNAALTPHNNFGQPGLPGWSARHDGVEVPANGHSEDATVGVGGALKLLDDNDAASGGFKSSHATYYIGENNDDNTSNLGKTGSVLVARVRVNDAAANDGAGAGFGLSSVDGNWTHILGLKNGALSITGWQQGNVHEYPGSMVAVPGGTNGIYRTYAISHTVDLSGEFPGFNHPQYDVWVLNIGGNPNNQADWTQVITNLHPISTAGGINNQAMPSDNYPGDPDPPNGYTVESGIHIGSYGPGYNPPGFGRTTKADMDFDWLTLVTNPLRASQGGYGITMYPWNVDYSQVPEPSSLLVFAGLAGFALCRRRRAAA
jgi:hypothetical protein